MMKQIHGDTIRTIQGKWQYVDTYDQRVLINRFMELHGDDSSREDWLVFLAGEFELTDIN